MNSFDDPQALSHSINIVKCRGCIYGQNLEATVALVASSLEAPHGQAPFQVFVKQAQVMKDSRCC